MFKEALGGDVTMLGGRCQQDVHRWAAVPPALTPGMLREDLTCILPGGLAEDGIPHVGQTPPPPSHHTSERAVEGTGVVGRSSFTSLLAGLTPHCCQTEIRRNLPLLLPGQS